MERIHHRRFRNLENLVKFRGAARMPMLINTQRGQWKLSQRGIRNNWPALLHDMRQTGNSQLDPLIRFGSSIQTIGQMNTEPWAWEYLASRLAHLERQDRGRYQPVVSGFDIENPLYVSFRNAIAEFRGGSFWMGIADMDDALAVFSRVCVLLGQLRDRYDRRHGFGPGIYMEIIEMARMCAPLVAEIDYDYGNLVLANGFSNINFYSMLQAVNEMCKGDVQTLERVLDTLPLTYQGDVLQDAKIDWQVNGSFLAREVIIILN